MFIRQVFLLWLLFPAVVHAFYQWHDGNSSLELTGFGRALTVAANNPNDELLFSDDKVLTGGVIGRLMLDAQLSSFSTEVHIAQSIIDTQLRTGGSRFLARSDVERSDALHWRYANEHADLFIDRFNVQYSADTLNIKFGRQPINLASTFYFSPNDFFSPFAAQTFFRTYKSGVDAARLDWQWGELSQLSVMAILEYQTDFEQSTAWSTKPDWSETSYLARSSTLLDTFEIAVLLAKVHSDDIIGFDFQGELFEWLGVRGEGHLRFPDEVSEDNDVKISLSLEHRWENTLTLRVEQFYQRSGADNEQDYATELSDSTNLYLAKNYTALGASYEITPLLLGDAVWLFNLNDSSSLLALYSNYSLSDESELSIGLNIPIGTQPGNGVLNSEFGSYPKSFTMEYRLYF